MHDLWEDADEETEELWANLIRSGTVAVNRPTPSLKRLLDKIEAKDVARCQSSLEETFNYYMQAISPPLEFRWRMRDVLRNNPHLVRLFTDVEYRDTWIREQEEAERACRICGSIEAACASLELATPEPGLWCQHLERALERRRTVSPT
jgi:hypothetical protein